MSSCERIQSYGGQISSTTRTADPSELSCLSSCISIGEFHGPFAPHAASLQAYYAHVSRHSGGLGITSAADTEPTFRKRLRRLVPIVSVQSFPKPTELAYVQSMNSGNYDTGDSVTAYLHLAGQGTQHEPEAVTMSRDYPCECCGAPANYYYFLPTVGVQPPPARVCKTCGDTQEAKFEFAEAVSLLDHLIAEGNDLADVKEDWSKTFDSTLKQNPASALQFALFCKQSSFYALTPDDQEKEDIE